MVSVIVPTYNSAPTLRQCLDAIRRAVVGDHEILVVDACSSDSTRAIASAYTENIIEQRGRGRSHGRNLGLAAARGDVVVNVDSDIVVRKDSIRRILDYLGAHPEVDAVTGTLAVEHPNEDFFSQYKNLYMHHTFSLLPDSVTFLSGSIFAVRKHAAPVCELSVEPDDTVRGQALFSKGKKIAFLRDLEVVHLKRYTGLSLMKNDFMTPFEWVTIFLHYKGWTQLFRHQTGYAHASRLQLCAVVLAPATLLIAGAATVLASSALAWTALGVAGLWCFVNRQFLLFLTRQRGVVFGFASVLVTFLDQVVMATGICCGIATSALKKLRLMWVQRRER